MDTRIPWPTPGQDMLASVILCVGGWVVVVVVVSGSIVMKVQMATMLKGRVMNGREKVLRRLLRALVMKTLKQKSDRIIILVSSLTLPQSLSLHTQ